MWWLWIAGPIAVLVVFALTAKADARRIAEADEWAKSTGVKKVGAAPSDLGRMFEEVGGGKPLRVFELLPKLAYLGVFEADASAGSDHQTVVCKLDAVAPAFTARPLPIVEGSRVANAGVPFPKHAAFAELYLVEGARHADIKKWLTRPLRKALLDLPDLWLRTDGKAMALTLYGRADFEAIDELCAIADTLFAEHGADGGPSLLPDLDDADDDDGADDEEEDEEEEEAAAPPPKMVAKPAPPAKAGKAAKPVPVAAKSGKPGKSKGT